METVEEFLAHAIQLEREAADRFAHLADAMDAGGNKEVSKLFRQLAHYSRLHLADARKRSGFRDIPVLGPDDFEWPDAESPESAAIWAADPLVGPDEALATALAAESAGLSYYAQVLAKATDPEIIAFAKAFVAEEEGHVAELNRWIAARAAGLRMPITT
ncbi:ferritin family protein [Novosphingobium profundi]|uniref:ferritin-like domain-containing protein n=1 Tax=Novosphingobium profundi TaxID=1774954 RepID=UPI001BDA4342|nr:ferritin family protein [Novosphingobium profundi]MBT0668048.1 ferritin family protein [Novosphingobium profundi]